jgi:hypothetical protein
MRTNVPCAKARRIGRRRTRPMLNVPRAKGSQVGYRVKKRTPEGEKLKESMEVRVVAAGSSCR